MSILEFIFIGSIYILIGSLVASCYSFSAYINPLWKLPICLLWPLTLVVQFVWLLITEGLIEWIQSVIEYYQNKKKRGITND